MNIHSTELKQIASSGLEIRCTTSLPVMAPWEMHWFPIGDCVYVSPQYYDALKAMLPHEARD